MVYIAYMYKKRVLHLITGLERGGGAENMILNIVPKLEKTENTVCVMKGKGEIAKELESLGIKVCYLNFNSIFSIKSIFKYRNVVREYKPDIQVNYLIHADIFGRLFGKFYKVPNVISYIRNRHEEKIFFWLDHLTIKLSDFILVNSKPLIDFYNVKHKVKKDKIKFIPNAIDIEKIEKLSQEKIDFEFDENIKYIISVSRFHKQKDIPTLIKAFNEVCKIKNNVRLLLLSDGPEKNIIINLVKELKLEDMVSFIGKVNNVYPYIKKSDLFVLTSRYEGMSNSLLEAMALKIPVVVSNIPENIQLIQNRECFFNIGNYEKLSEIIINILKSNNIKNINKNYDTIVNKCLITKVVKECDYFLGTYE
jgi:glycosyltransferase involved in cell wall biosynthesis